MPKFRVQINSVYLANNFFKGAWVPPLFKSIGDIVNAGIQAGQAAKAAREANAAAAQAPENPTPVADVQGERPKNFTNKVFSCFYACKF